jgi:membrane-associated phospholipid phosphatase
MARRWQGRAAMLGALLLLGVGVAVHVVLKDQWGRPRPEQVQAFGGDKVFQPWWQPSGECARNCAFVSGHAATGYALMGLGLLAAPARRRRWLAAGWAAGGAIGLVRMVQGGHFASDVLGAGLVTWGVGLALRRWVLWRRLRRWQRRPLA